MQTYRLNFSIWNISPFKRPTILFTVTLNNLGKIYLIQKVRTLRFKFNYYSYIKKEKKEISYYLIMSREILRGYNQTDFRYHNNCFCLSVDTLTKNNNS